jgi:hypothetical protein
LTSDFFFIPSHDQWHQSWQQSQKTWFGVVLFTAFLQVAQRFRGFRFFTSTTLNATIIIKKN